METASCSYAHLCRTVAMFFVITLVSQIAYKVVAPQCSPARALLLCMLWSNVMWKHQTLSGAKLRRKG